MPTAISKDGTKIVYEKRGAGPSIILVNGALASREFYGEKDLAEKLEDKFTIIYYDRRGRGDSTDTKPYSREREIEDIEVLLNEVGGRAYLYGCSSGAALALLAAEKFGPENILKLALYEPPYTSDTGEYAEGKKKVNEFIAADNPGDAVAAFLEIAGTPPEALEKMKQSPDWKKMVKLGPTLTYDFEVLGDGAIPEAVVKNIAIPTLALNGGESDSMSETASTLAKLIPFASHKTLKGQSHEVAPEVLAPVLIDFFK
ncbi:MAG: alpha/beta hydrolase [Chitinophagaceae bacterium]|nr:alpha/beta hydrolase [Chitinophagaceae bacterium]